MSFVLARLKSSHTAPVRELVVADGEDFSRGALLLVDANGAYAEVAAAPTAIAAVAESDFGADTGGFGGHGRSEFPPGMMQGTKVQDEVEFSAEYVGTLPAAIGGSYGVVRGADGQWRVNFDDIAAPVVKLTNLSWTEAPLNKNRVLVTFLPAVVQVI